MVVGLKAGPGPSYIGLFGFIALAALTLFCLYQQRYGFDSRLLTTELSKLPTTTSPPSPLISTASLIATPLSTSSSIIVAAQDMETATAARTLSNTASPISRPSQTAKVIPPSTSNATDSTFAPRVEVVVASTSSENTTWLSERLHDWDIKTYHVDDPSADLTVPLNRGNEAMVYLTYIIDNYDTLPDIVLFSHARRFQWHNDDKDYDGLAVFRRLRLPYVQEQGYVNLRCSWTLGCPVEIRPFEDEGTENPGRKQAAVFRVAFEEILPRDAVPEAVGQNCCAQFGVTRAAIQSRDVSEYVHMRKWLIETSLEDDITGRVFEYLWHIIFGKPAMNCQDVAQCYCSVFGLCELECGERDCDGMFSWPPSFTLPKTWPYLGWSNESRGFNELPWK